MRSNSEGKKKPKKNNIAQFPQKKKTEVKEEDFTKRLKREHRKKYVTVYRICLLAILLMGLATAYFIYENTKVFDTYSVVSSTTEHFSDNSELYEFDGGIMTYGKDGAKAVDVNGTLLWNCTFDMQSPMMSMCGDTVAFADYGGSTVYIQKSDGTLKTVNTDKPVRKIAVSSAGYFVAVLEDTSITWIYMYDMNGTEIAYFKTTMEKSGYPVSIDISPSGELVSVSYYLVDCDEVISSVAFYNFGPVGQNQIDNLVSGYNYSDTLMATVKFMDSQTAYSVSQKKLCVYSGDHSPRSVSDMFITDNILSVYNSEDAIAVIYKNGDYDPKYRLEVYDRSGERMLKKEFSFDYSGVAFGNERVILYGDTNVVILTYSGEVRFEGNYSSAISLLLPTNVSSKYVFVTENTIDIVEFK